MSILQEQIVTAVAHLVSLSHILQKCDNVSAGITMKYKTESDVKVNKTEITWPLLIFVKQHLLMTFSLVLK